MLASPYPVIFAVAAVFTKIDDLAQVQRGTHPDLWPIRKNGVMQLATYPDLQTIQWIGHVQQATCPFAEFSDCL